MPLFTPPDVPPKFLEPCRHKSTKEISTRPYFYPVGKPSERNNMAHGGTETLWQCMECGASRAVNQNGPHKEFGTWVMVR